MAIVIIEPEIMVPRFRLFPYPLIIVAGKGLFVQPLKGNMSWVEIVKDRLPSIGY